MKKGKIIPLASVTCILDQFEAKALQSIKIDATIKCDNYESVGCLLYTSPSPRDRQKSRMPSSA